MWEKKENAGHKLYLVFPHVDKRWITVDKFGSHTKPSVGKGRISATKTFLPTQTPFLSTVIHNFPPPWG